MLARDNRWDLDSYIRCHYDRELGTDSLVPIATLPERIARWRAVTGAVLGLAVGDLTDTAFVTWVLQRVRPDTVIHLAEQRSAPYSMIDQDHAVHTQVNNVVGTLNVLWAIAQTDPTIHLIKLGTMGEYGTPNIDIEEVAPSHPQRQNRRPALPETSGVLLPSVEGPRQPQHPLLLPSLGAAGDRPQSGCRLRS
jgi:nucleoside-diphosphate-sugar epimerase